MIEYSRFLLVVFYLFLFILIRVLDKKNVKYIYIVLINSILIALFYGCRSYNVGIDTIQYVNRYINGTVGFDYGFEFLTIGLHYLFGGDIRLYLITINLIINILVGLSICKQIDSRNSIYIFYITSMFPYYIEGNINIIRQALAMSFVLFGLSNLEKNKTICLLFLLMSILVHKMFFFVVIIFFVLRKFQCSPKMIIIISLTLIMLCQTPLIYEILTMFKSNGYVSKLIRYISVLDYKYILKVIFHYTFFLITYLISEQKKHSNLFTLYMAIILCGALFSMSPLYSARFFVCIDFILVSHVYLSIKDSLIIDVSYKNKLTYAVFMFFILYSYASTYLNALSTDLLLK